MIAAVIIVLDFLLLVVVAAAAAYSFVRDRSEDDRPAHVEGGRSFPGPVESELRLRRRGWD